MLCCDSTSRLSPVSTVRGAVFVYLLAYCSYHAFIFILLLVLSHLEHECTVFQEVKLRVKIIPVFCQGWDLLCLQTKKPSYYYFLDTGKGYNERLYYPWHSGQPEHQHISISSSCIRVAPGSTREMLCAWCFCVAAEEHWVWGTDAFIGSSRKASSSLTMISCRRNPRKWPG